MQGLFVILSGRVALFVDRGGSLQKAIEWRGGDVAGLLPYSRLVNPPGDAIVQEPTTLLVPRDDLRAMIRECYEVTSILVHTMVDRARIFTSSDLLDEKLKSLGKLSAGLAHELNNPVAAIERARRAARGPAGGRRTGHARARRGAAAPTPAGGARCRSPPACRRPRQGRRSPLEEAEREEAIADWLDDHGLDAASPKPLAETAVTLQALDASRSGRRPGAGRGPALGGRGLLGALPRPEIHEAAMRVSGLVMAIKGFTHMDQAPVAEPVDLGRGLADTVAVLRRRQGEVGDGGRRRRPGSAARPRLRRRTEPGLVQSDRQRARRHSRGRTRRRDRAARRQRVVVRIWTTGPAFPPTIRERIFDPFFTTKRSDRARASASTSSGAWSAATRATSTSSRCPGERSSVCRCHSRALTPTSKVNKPVILIVDDDPQVLAAVRRDLRSQYRENYSLVGASSGEQAVSTIKDLKGRGDDLALVISEIDAVTALQRDRWLLIAICLAWPVTIAKFVFGNPVIWGAAALAYGTSSFDGPAPSSSSSRP